MTMLTHLHSAWSLGVLLVDRLTGTGAALTECLSVSWLIAIEGVGAF